MGERMTVYNGQGRGRDEDYSSPPAQTSPGIRDDERTGRSGSEAKGKDGDSLTVVGEDKR